MANLQCNAVSSCRVGHHLLPIMCAPPGAAASSASPPPPPSSPTRRITWALFSALFCRTGKSSQLLRSYSYSTSKRANTGVRDADHSGPQNVTTAEHISFFLIPYYGVVAARWKRPRPTRVFQSGSPSTFQGAHGGCSADPKLDLIRARLQRRQGSIPWSR
jgi:hypothetical protein